jgi:hypothetical protein
MGDEVANAVYERTLSALTGLLPRRAATSVLDRALRRHRRNADEISGEQMAHVLLQGVYRELRDVVPDPGLRRTLRKLARDARAWSLPLRGATPSEVRAGPVQEPTTVLIPVSAEPPRGESIDVDAVAAKSAAVAAKSAAVPANSAAVAAKSAAVAAKSAALAAKSAALAAKLAALDGVHGVGLFEASGRPVDVRGALPDAAALGGMVAAGAALVARREALRSVTIDTPQGRLVAIPVQPRWLALTGTVDVNLGAVYAALAALEEER